ncbi:hypothetical protein F2P56_013184 [Juglans regia]|uniref:Uncharacterized protein LOC108998596 n=2 Tax=Juglans regia TaxID=51240 RepID=A0A2I4FGG3_JUGRE|nr:uncharacterized protein LOC108998596 [Juglans regia]XP_035547038.1 uncharacterized protein LOC108998596 [Juglans regia]KAF5469088.1 hypothetical protein F2P56_013184 [Juglans regia]
MMGTGMRFGPLRGENRFYVPSKGRKNQNQQKQARRVKKGDETERLDSSPTSKDPPNSLTKPLELPLKPASNLDRFLESTTPFVPAQYFSKTTMRGLRTCDVEFQPYFMLNDLWETFKERSAYGVGVPFVLNEGDSVVQYYVPYLSGIQLYGEPATRSNAKPRQAGEESDNDYYRDSSSDGSSDHESDKGIKFTREQLVHNHLRGEVPIRLARLSITNDHTARQQGFSSDDFEAGNSQGRLLFEFLEQDLPYCREPLADKILDLACRYPGLRTLRSCDLLPASWMSVAWYPIYRIPTGPTLKDLDACFLTYHTLSAPMTGSGSTQASIIYPSEIDDVPKISMRAFGMASYKLKGCMWAQHGASESQLANSLMQAADSWLRLLQVNHPDFKFFASHGMH